MVIIEKTVRMFNPITALIQMEAPQTIGPQKEIQIHILGKRDIKTLTHRVATTTVGHLTTQKVTHTLVDGTTKKLHFGPLAECAEGFRK